MSYESGLNLNLDFLTFPFWTPPHPPVYLPTLSMLNTIEYIRHEYQGKYMYIVSSIPYRPVPNT